MTAPVHALPGVGASHGLLTAYVGALDEHQGQGAGQRESFAIRTALGRAPLDASPLRNACPRILYSIPTRNIRYGFQGTMPCTVLRWSGHTGVTTIVDLPARVLLAEYAVDRAVAASHVSAFSYQNQHDVVDLVYKFAMREETLLLYAQATDEATSMHRDYTIGRGVAPLIPGVAESNPTPGAFHGLFAQLGARDSGCTRVVDVPRRTLPSVIVGTIRAMCDANGIAPTAIYMGYDDTLWANMQMIETYDQFVLGAQRNTINGVPYHYHPALVKGQILLATDRFAPDLARQLHDQDLLMEIPAPISMGLYEDYTLTASTAGAHVRYTLHTVGALRVHVPRYFGWITVQEETP